MKTTNQNTLRVMISGGGTGGHVYPALAIAGALKAEMPGCVIEFVGAEGRMEMEKVSQHGYKIHGIWISGIQRKALLKNVTLPFKLASSLLKVNKIINTFKPDVVVGVGGYASGPLLYISALKKIPTLIQEQNSYPGVTNKLLAGKAKKICVAYPGLEKYFPQEKIIETGNPVRNFENVDALKDEALKHFSLNVYMPTVLIIGGSLGSGTLNNTLLQWIAELAAKQIQLIWQTGKYYFENINNTVGGKYKNIHVLPFIDRMDYAYAAADLVVSRAGAISISELALAGKAVILVPSPNVAEDHQTKNAKVLTEAGTAIMVSDADASEKLVPEMLHLSEDKNKIKTLAARIKAFAKPNAAQKIAEEIIKLAQNKK